MEAWVEKSNPVDVVVDNCCDCSEVVMAEWLVVTVGPKRVS